MHLWPSMTLRESFKTAYLKKLELNLHLMKLDKKKRQQEPQQPSTSDVNGCREKLLKKPSTEDQLKGGGKLIAVWKELVLIVSCCYCCFGCGAFADDEGF